MGVDGIAHEAAFPNTIAVLAGSIECGFVHINKHLIERCKENALVISEYEKNIEPRAWNFVHRNRLVTGLANAVCVMEADMRSGSITSANYAIEQGKPLFVLPHELDKSGGTNMLLSQRKAEAIWSEEFLLNKIGLNAQQKTDDKLLIYCSNRPSFEEALERFGAQIYEYELAGKIAVKEGRVECI